MIVEARLLGDRWKEDDRATALGETTGPIGERAVGSDEVINMRNWTKIPVGRTRC